MRRGCRRWWGGWGGCGRRRGIWGGGGWGGGTRRPLGGGGGWGGGGVGAGDGVGGGDRAARGGGRLLWVVVDLIAVSREMVVEFREWAKRELGLEGDQVMVSATHTHSGPATIRLNAAGRVDEEY